MRFIVLLAAIGLISCTSLTTIQTIEVRYDGRGALSNVRLQDPRGKSFTFGNLGTGYSKGYGGDADSMMVKSKDVYLVTWTDSSGQSHRVEVDVGKEMPNGVRGDVEFRIDEKGDVSLHVKNRKKNP
jgi:hypothetical protein